MSHPTCLTIIPPECTSQQYFRVDVIHLKSASGEKRCINRNIDDVDARQRSREVSIIYCFETWRQMDGLSYEAHSLVAYWFSPISSYAQVFSLEVHNIPKIAWVFQNSRLNFSHVGSAVSATAIVDLSAVTHNTFDACINLNFPEVH